MNLKNPAVARLGQEFLIENAWQRKTVIVHTPKYLQYTCSYIALFTSMDK